MLRPGSVAPERDEQGAVAIMTAVCAIFLFVVAALVVDLGLARDVKRQSQNAADASALAAANVLYPATGTCSGVTSASPPCFDDAITAVVTYAEQNFQVKPADWGGCVDPQRFYVPPGSTPCISFTDDTLAAGPPVQPTKVKVVIPTRIVPAGLGALAGVSEIPVSSSARATLDVGQARSCGLCLLGAGLSGLGNGDVTVNGGSVFSNGSLDTGPNGHMTATPSPNTITTVGTCAGNCLPAAQTGAAPIDDPYAGLALPPSHSSLTSKISPCTQGPGIYPGLELPDSNCTLSPGLYVLTGMWTMKNNTVLQGTGVTLYGTCGSPFALTVCTSDQSGGGLDTKNGETQIVAPASGPEEGYAIIYDRENSAGINIQGNGNSFVTGAIYARKALLEFPGNSCVTVTNGPIIVGSLYGNGNKGCVNLTSSVGADIPAPPNGVSLDQ